MGATATAAVQKQSVSATKRYMAQVHQITDGAGDIFEQKLGQDHAWPGSRKWRSASSALARRLEQRHRIQLEPALRESSYPTAWPGPRSLYSL